MARKLTHIKQSDRSIDRELQELVQAVNVLIDKVGDPSSSFPTDIGKQSVQAVNVGPNLFSVAVKTQDGFTYSVPGIFQKVNTIPAIGKDGQVLVSDERGIVRWVDIDDVGAVNSITGTTPIVVNSTVPAIPVISIPAATTSVNGYLTSTDWNTFNNKLSVTDVPGIRSGTISLTADDDTTVTYSSSLVSGTVNAIALSCKDSDGAEVEVTISGTTVTHFHAVCPVNATLIWIAVKEL